MTSGRGAFGSGLALVLMSLSAAAAEPKFDHYVRLTPENAAIGNYPAQKKAILTIKSGDTVKIDTGGGAGWRRSSPVPW